MGPAFDIVIGEQRRVGGPGETAPSAHQGKSVQAARLSGAPHT